MSYLLIIANTPSPNTERLRDAVARGAASSDFPVRVYSPQAVSAEDIVQSAGIIIGTTENFGYMSGLLKDLFERIYYPCLEQTQAKPWALYVKAGLDGTGAINSVERIVTGLRWKAIQPPLLLKGDFQDSFIEDCETLGAGMAAGLSLGIF